MFKLIEPEKAGCPQTKGATKITCFKKQHHMKLQMGNYRCRNQNLKGLLNKLLKNRFTLWGDLGTDISSFLSALTDDSIEFAVSMLFSFEDTGEEMLV
mmetsp:Transcript_30675/g.40537  ORF Transcript_30675/g.40537 Transcript_30675/m.40537 type:complete len:98 (-) Transcript_30675:650-943(-)